MKQKIPYESYEQTEIFRWARANQIDYPELQLLNASLAGFKFTPGQSRKAKAQGMRKGYPDIFLPVTTNQYAGLFIELKRIKGGSVSREQKAFLNRLNEQRYLAVVCKGHKEAIHVVKEYLNIA